MMYDFNGKKDLIIFIIASRKIKEFVGKNKRICEKIL